MKLNSVCIILILSFFSSNSWGWGRRGHEMVGSLAAQVLAKSEPKAAFLSRHSFELGYYNNVPDIYWKSKDEIYKQEWNQHFIDFEIFDKAFKDQNVEPTWYPQRKDFFSRFKVETSAGRVFWRIQEFNKSLETYTKQLMNKDLSKEERQKIQNQWLTLAGLMGHYIADLSQPLHVTHNYDGKFSGQPGVHSWYEDVMVDELYPLLHKDIFEQAKKRWPEFNKKNKDKSVFQLSIELARESSKYTQKLLDMDKKMGRNSRAKAMEAYKPMLLENFITGVLYLAQAWNTQLAWGDLYNGERFFTFSYTPEFIPPPKD